MALLLITHELKTAGKDYTPYFETIKREANGWWHYLENVWIVNTWMTPHQFAQKLYPHITKDDRLLIVKITVEQQGWLPQDAWNWLNTGSY